MKASADEERVKCVIFSPTVPAPPFCASFLEHLNRRKVEAQEWRLLEKCKLVLSFVLRHLFVWLHFGKKRAWASHPIISWTTLYHISSTVCWFCKEKKKKTLSLRYTETAYLYMYCIDKVQSLLLQNRHFEHHINHWDWDSETYRRRNKQAVFGPSLRVKAPTFIQLPSTNCCVMLSMERRDFHSDLRKVCQDATSYRASHLTAAETLPFVLRDDTWRSTADTTSWGLSQQGKIASYTRRKAFVNLYFQGILTRSYTLYYVTVFLLIMQPFSIDRGFYLKFYLNSWVFLFTTSYGLSHLSFGALRILHSVCLSGGELYFRRYIFYLVMHFLLGAAAKRLVSPIRKLRGFLEIPKVELHIVPELSF